MIVSQTPLRISFFGGGTDIADYYSDHGGAVLSSTIDKYVYVIVKARYDANIVLNYSEREHVESVDEIRHPIIREALKLVGIKSGIEITCIADIPSQGSGLGSSSSFTVGLLNALFVYADNQQNPTDLARLACEIEIGRLSEPIGKQDQYASAIGGFRRYEFLPDGSVSAALVSVSEPAVRALQQSSLLFFTGQTRKAGTVLGEQRKNLAQNLESLHAIKQLVSSHIAHFESGAIAAIGHGLHESWLVKKRLAGSISNSGIDQMYDRCLASGAYGGKVLGAGGGGFLFVLAPGDRADQIRKEMKDHVELRFHYVNHGTRIIFNIQDSSFRFL